MPFKTGLDLEKNLPGKSNKDFADIYDEEELSVERFHKMERRIMVQWIIMLVMMFALAFFMYLNISDSLSKVANTGEIQVNGLSKDINLKVSAIIDDLDAAKKNLGKEIALVRELTQQARKFLDETAGSVKKLKASKQDKNEASKLREKERVRVDKAVKAARVKTDTAVGALRAKTDKAANGFLDRFGDVDKKAADLAKDMAGIKRNAETLEENIASIQTGLAALNTNLVKLAAAKADAHAIENKLALLKKDAQTRENRLQNALDQAARSLEKRIMELEKAPASQRSDLPVVKPLEPRKPMTLLPDGALSPEEEADPKPVEPVQPEVIEPESITEQDLGD